MTRSPTNEDRLTRYLLGLMPEKERIELEDVYLPDDDLNQQIQAAERDLMDRYLDGSLSETERKRFEKFFLSSPGRVEKFRFAQALKAYGSKQARNERTSILSRFPLTPALMNSFIRSYAGVAAFAVLAIALGLIIWRTSFFRSPEKQTTLALTKAYEDGRLFESRISDLGYTPLAQSRGDNRNSIAIDLRQAELIAVNDKTEHPGARSFRNLGRVYLAWQRLDEALEWLRKAAQADPRDAKLQSDLGAALLEHGRQNANREEAAKDLAESLEHLTNAVQLEDRLLEARFNRALCYESLRLMEQAKAEWQSYLQWDSDSGWATEARTHLSRLEESERRSHLHRERDFEEFIAAGTAGDDTTTWKLLSRNRDRSDNTITQRLIDEYLKFAEEGRSKDAGERLRLISLAGRLEREQAGDNFTADLAGYYARATAAQSKILAQGRALCKQASLLYTGAEYEKAVSLYRQAESMFSHAGDGCEALAARFWVGACLLREPDTNQALAISEQLAALSSRRSYRLLQAQSLTSIADAQGSRREFSLALESAGRAMTIYDGIQDKSGAIRGLQIPVVFSQIFGEYNKSIGLAFRGLDVASEFWPEPRETWPFYHQIAFNLNELGRPTIALEFGVTALRLAEQSGTPLLKSRSYARLAAIHERLRNYQEAVKNGQLALDEAQAVGGAKTRTNLIANSTLQLAHLNREVGAFDTALSYYDRAIELHHQLKLEIYGAEAHKGRLQSLIGLNDEQAIVEEIRTSISLLEKDRARIKEDSDRISYFDLAQSTYDLAIEFTYSRLNDSAAAFAYSEASRGRSLLDLVSTGGSVLAGREGPELQVRGQTRPLNLSEIQERLPSGSQILQYSMLEDKVIAWVISRTSFKSAHYSVPVDELTGRVNALLAILAKAPPRDLPQAGSIGKSLYDILIRPVLALLDPSCVVFIVPDKVLNYVPFAALLCPETERYFVEDFVFELAPSSSLMISCSQRANERSGPRNERILSVGNPTFDRAKYPLLQDLPSAAREADLVARLYSSSKILIGPEADAQQLKAAMLDADVIHFAGHYIANERSPLTSRLLLSKNLARSGGNGDEDGDLSASEVYRMPLRRARLVVLSACGTGIERYYRGEGALGIARPFIKAGAPVVIASLWPVDSEPTARLMIDFHSRRKLNGLNVVEALRAAQLSMLNSSESSRQDPHTWAAFVPIGGLVKF